MFMVWTWTHSILRTLAGWRLGWRHIQIHQRQAAAAKADLRMGTERHMAQDHKKRIIQGRTCGNFTVGGMWTSFRQLSSSPLASSNPCTRRITGLAKSARLSAPLRCTLSEINSESLACRWAHLAVNTRAKSQKSQVPTISNTCWNRAISWSWKHSTCWTKHAKVTHGKTKIWQSILTVLSQHYPALKLKIVATLKILGIHLSSLKILIFYMVPMT